MYAVIFRAKVAQFDAGYHQTAERMRDMALREYGCLEFSSCCEDGREIAISYWDNEEQIKRWKKNADHLAAQENGRSTWYESYSVEVVEVVRAYSFDASPA